MKQLIFIIFILLLISCKKEQQKEPFYTESTEKQTAAELGKEIFEGKGNCFSCHNPTQKIIGPSIQDIAKIYKSKKGNIISFLKDDAEPIVDPPQFAVMRTNLFITKSMTDEELKAIEAYIYSNSK